MMRRPVARLAAACALAVATMAFTGSAVAGGGNSANAPGQQKEEQAAAQPQAQQPTAQASQPAAQNTPPGQAKKAATPTAQPAATHSSPGQAKQAAKASSSSPGVKPASGTTHWTHCVTGTSASGVTCTSSDNGNTPQTKADVSKQYGNGKTAAEIAVSRGGVNVQLTGPGNSQPHKVTVCGKPNNKSGGVDVHAVKSYDTSACQPTQAAVTRPTAPCGYKVVATTSVAGPAHGHGQGLSHNKHETSSTTYSVQADSTQSCSAAPVSPPNAPVNGAPINGGPVTGAPVTGTPVTGGTPQVTPIAGAAPATSNSGGVLGAHTTLAAPKTHPHHGVLGTVAHISGTSLPFTGFPLWIAVVIAAALIVAGFAVRRRGFSTR
jgi:hypothetical protein